MSNCKTFHLDRQHDGILTEKQKQRFIRTTFNSAIFDDFFFTTQIFFSENCETYGNSKDNCKDNYGNCGL